MTSRVSPAVDRLVQRFEKAATGEANATVCTATTLFLANFIVEADIDGKEQLVDDLAAAIKKYLKNMASARKATMQ